MSVVDELLKGPQQSISSEQATAPSAPPEPDNKQNYELAPVDPNAIPPSYNPEAAQQDIPQISRPTSEGITNYKSNASEGQTTNDADVPLDIPPADYVPNPSKQESIKQPLISYDEQRKQSYIKENDYNDYNDYPANKWYNRARISFRGKISSNSESRKGFGGMLACCVIAIVLLIVGIVMYENALEWKREAVKSICSITDWTSSSCSYQCHCHTDDDGHKHCSTCYGNKYKYYATTPVCNNGTETLHWNDGGSCPQSKDYNVGYQASCWVRCNKSEFSWSSPTAMIVWAIVVISIGGCVSCGLIGVALVFCRIVSKI